LLPARVADPITVCLSLIKQANLIICDACPSLQVFENDLRQRAFTQIATGGVKVKDDGSIKRRQSNQKGTPTPTEPITKQEVGVQACSEPSA
jgi:hypothetical protein